MLGLDMTYAFMKALYGTDDLDPMMDTIEYAPHTNPHWDPFSVVYNVSFSPLNARSSSIIIVPVDSWRGQERVAGGLRQPCWIYLILNCIHEAELQL